MRVSEEVPGRAVYLGVALIAGAGLALEILLLRVLSIVHWHHSAFLVISLALLGFGASGTFLCFAGDRLAARFTAAFRVLGLCAAVSIPVCLHLAGGVGFNALELLWDPRQWARLCAVYLLLMVPFFFIGCGIGLALRCFPSRIPGLYGADLAGAGAGSALVIAGMYQPGTAALPWLVASLCAVAAAAPAGRWIARAACVLLAAGLAAGMAGAMLEASEHKRMSRMLEVPGTGVILRRESPLAEISVLESRQLPLRDAPGLSLAAEAGPPPQLALFFDRDRMEIVDSHAGDNNKPDYLDFMPDALPYHLPGWEGSERRVLVLGLGGGRDVLRAIDRGARSVDVVEVDAALASLVAEEMAGFSGWPLLRPAPRIHQRTPRAFLAAAQARWDLVVLPLTGAGTAESAGLGAAGADFLLTREGIAAAWAGLADDGMLVATRWLRVPPRDSLRLGATLAAVMREAGIADPERHLAVLRSWETVTVLASRRPLDSGTLDAVRGFARARLFDLAWLPGLEAEETNRYNRFAEAWLYRGLGGILGPDAGGFLDAYKFHVRPVSDDSPYFSRFMKISTLPELYARRGQGGLTLVERGYPLLWATLVQALVLGLVLVLLPLRWLPRPEGTGGSGAGGWRVAVYFLCIGLAFLFIEMAFIQRITLYLGHPVLAAALSLSGFLVAAGIGSHCAGRWARHRGLAAGALAGTLLGASMWLFAAEPLFGAVASAQTWQIALLVLAGVFPLGLCMGMPFAIGMRALRDECPERIPWAWGINGCASVVSAVLAVLLAMHLGFNAVVGIALALYVLAWAVRPRSPAPAD